MPGLDARHSGPPSLRQALVPVSGEASAPHLAADAWLYPASAPISLLVVAGCAALLWRYRRRVAAAAWVAAWVAGNAVETLLKHVDGRPALYATAGQARLHVAAFDGSFPSGHALRATLAAGAVAAVAPRLRLAGVLYVATVAPLLVADGWHTPSDVVGGLLFGTLLVLAARRSAVARR